MLRGYTISSSLRSSANFRVREEEGGGVSATNSGLGALEDCEVPDRGGVAGTNWPRWPQRRWVVVLRVTPRGAAAAGPAVALGFLNVFLAVSGRLEAIE